MIGVRERAAELGYAAGWNLVRAAPAGLAGRAFRAAADAATVHNGRSARQLRANLRRVLGPGGTEAALDELVGEGLRSYARYWMEAFRLPRMDHRAIADYVDAHQTGAHHMFDALDVGGKGLIITLPHLGNWDAVGAWFVVRRGPFTTVVERLRPESLFDRFVAYRESLGFEIVPLTGGDQSPMGVLTQRLRANGTVCLVADRDLSSSGIEVDFFGEPARMPPGPALLAATTGAALVPAAPYFTPDGWGLYVDPPIELQGQRLRDQVRDGTQRLADVFATRIAEHPADWHMLQPLWTADLAPRPERER